MYYLSPWKSLLPGLHTTTYSGCKKNTDVLRVRKDSGNCTQSQAISYILVSTFSITTQRTYVGMLCLISQWGTITELNLQGLIAQCWQKSHIAGPTPSSLNHIFISSLLAWSYRHKGDFRAGLKQLCALNNTPECKTLSFQQSWMRNGYLGAQRQAVTRGNQTEQAMQADTVGPQAHGKTFY